MASRTLQALFLGAQTNAERSRRISWVGVLVAFVIHVGVWTPRLETARDRDEALFKSRTLRGLATELDRLDSSVAESSAKALRVVRESVEGLPALLATDLERLTLTIQAIRDESSLDGRNRGDAETGSPSSEDITVAPFELVDDRRIAAIRDASSRDQLIRALTPVVDELIIRPRFIEVQRRWISDALPELTARLDGVASSVPHLRSSLPATETEWERLIASMATLRRRTVELEITPPSHPDWWVLPGADLEPGLDPGVSELLRSPPASIDLAEDAAVFKTRIQALSHAVATQRAELLASPAGAETLPIYAFAPVVPALLGIFLALLTAGRSCALRELALSAHLHISRGAPLVVGEWCLQQLRWDLAVRSRPGPGRFALLQAFTIGILGSAWVALAVLQLYSLSALDQQRILGSASIGLAAVLLATIHRMWIVGSARTTLRQDLIEDQADGADQAGFEPAAATSGVDEASETTVIDAPLLDR